MHLGKELMNLYFLKIAGKNRVNRQKLTIDATFRINKP